MYEDFESGSEPLNWTQEYVNGSEDWAYTDGGYTTQPGIEGSGSPPYAYEGDYNALFHYTSLGQEATILITPPLDLEFALKPELHFMHAQYERYQVIGGEWENDYLTVLYKREGGNWDTLEETYTNVVPEWTFRRIVLPDTAKGGTFYIGFSAVTNNGYGVCIDSVLLIETDVVARYIDTITFHQPDTLFVSSGTDNNPVLRMDMRVEGNDQQVILNSINITSLNSNDNDIAANGVKLYATSDTFFNKDNQLGAGINFSGGKASFSALNYELSTGYTSIWVTYDVKEDAEQGNILDAMVDIDDISANSNTFPAVIGSPEGTRPIFQTVFSDDFEGSDQWQLTGEFEVGIPQGKGGDQGAADPTSAVSGDSVLGTDLYGIGIHEGDYEDSLSDRQYQAVSPELDCYYFNNMQLGFFQWLNVDYVDHVYIDVSKDGGNTWNEAWGNMGLITDDEWKWRVVDISDLADRATNLKLRFALGATDNSWVFSGWNIDDVFITGNYITNDIGIASKISPVNGRGHGADEPVTVVVKNYGAEASEDTIVLYYHFDDGYGRVFESYDTIYNSIPVEDSVIFTFDEKLDLSSPGVFYDAFITSIVKGDEDETNDTLKKDFFAMPTYEIPYSENFENGESFWLVNGFESNNNSSWELGIPQGAHIYSSNSGENAWVTNLNGQYRLNDSSFLVSSYFDFSGAELPVFQFSMWKDCQPQADGVTLQYSIDSGETWQHVSRHIFTWDWNWYNNDNINKFNTPGWDSLTPGYLSAKQVLPNATIDNIVLLRFAFASDDSITTHEGFAVDDVKLYNAPPDVGVLSIDYPGNSCELTAAEPVGISIKNFGVKDIHTGDTIVAGVIIDNEKTAIDTIILTDELLVDSVLSHEFIHKFDFYDAGIYHIKAFTSMKGDDNVYSDSSYTNDTAETSILVDRPYVDLGPNINTVEPDTIVLDAYEEPDNTYLWQDGNTDSVYHVNDGGLYIVTVTNTINCRAIDTVNVVRLIADYGIADIIEPVSDCELDDSLPVVVEIKNYGTDTADQNYSLDVILEFQGGPPVIETFNLADTLYPDSTVSFTFDATVDMPVEGVYELKVYTRYMDDDSVSNDTTTHDIEYYGYPDFDLKPDYKIHEGMSYTFDATTVNIISYTWHDSTAGPTYTFDTPGIHTASVTVTDIYNCSSADTSTLRIIVPDIGVKSLVSPTDNCGPLSNGNVTLNIFNFGTDTLESGTSFDLGCKVNTSPTSIFSGNYTTSKRFYPGDSVLFTFSNKIDLSFVRPYDYTSSVYLENDSIPENDTIISEMNIYELPSINLGKDTIIDTFRYELDAGAGFVRYKWQDNTANRKFQVNPETFERSSVYAVTVTDEHTCQDEDEINLQLNFKDIALTQLLLPEKSCKPLSKNEPIRIVIMNNGTMDIKKTNISVKASYKLNFISSPEEFVQIPNTFSPLDTVVHVFNNNEDMSVSGVYYFEILADVPMEDYTANNELDVYRYVYDPPVVDLGEDTVSKYLPYSLAPMSQYESYLWQDGSTNDSYLVEDPGRYAITVTDANDCPGYDTIYIRDKNSVPDIIIDNFVVEVYPNPANEYLRVIMDNKKHQQTVILQLTDNSGKEIYKNKSLISGKQIRKLSVSDLTPGVYYLSIIIENDVYKKVIVIQ